MSILYTYTSRAFFLQRNFPEFPNFWERKISQINGNPNGSRHALRNFLKSFSVCFFSGSQLFDPHFGKTFQNKKSKSRDDRRSCDSLSFKTTLSGILEIPRNSSL